MEGIAFLIVGIFLLQFFQNLRQRDSMDQLHREEGDAAFAPADVVDRDDVRMFQYGGDVRLFKKLELFAFGGVFGDRHGDIPSHIDVFRADDDFHSAGADHMFGMVPFVRGGCETIGRNPVRGASDDCCFVFRFPFSHPVSPALSKGCPVQ